MFLVSFLYLLFCYGIISCKIVLMLLELDYKTGGRQVGRKLSAFAYNNKRFSLIQHARVFCRFDSKNSCFFYF